MREPSRYLTFLRANQALHRKNPSPLRYGGFSGELGRWGVMLSIFNALNNGINVK
jgi:hypothetical protein